MNFFVLGKISRNKIRNLNYIKISFRYGLTFTIRIESVYAWSVLKAKKIILLWLQFLDSKKFCRITGVIRIHKRTVRLNDRPELIDGLSPVSHRWKLGGDLYLFYRKFNGDFPAFRINLSPNSLIWKSSTYHCWEQNYRNDQERRGVIQWWKM